MVNRNEYIKKWRASKEGRTSLARIHEYLTRNKSIGGVSSRLCKRCEQWLPLVKFRKQHKNTKRRQYTCNLCYTNKSEVLRNDTAVRRDPQNGRRKDKSAKESGGSNKTPNFAAGNRVSAEERVGRKTRKDGISSRSSCGSKQKRDLTHCLCFECEVVKSKKEMKEMGSGLWMCNGCRAQITKEMEKDDKTDQ